MTSACMQQALKTADPAAWDTADWTDMQTSDKLEHCFYDNMGNTIASVQ
jgi:hypothetical protein